MNPLCSTFQQWLNLLSGELGTKSYYAGNRLRVMRTELLCSHNTPFMPNILFFILFSADFPPFPSPTQPSVLLGEDPPPYSPLTSPESGSAPVISCRVCQSLISVEGKIHQHVVKCGVCNEATVGSRTSLNLHTLIHRVPNVCEKCKLGVCTYPPFLPSTVVPGSS